jgi:hypothetical protein
VRLLKFSLIVFGAVLFLLSTTQAMAAVPLQVNVDQVLNSQSFSSSINLLLAISAISLIPFFLMSTTSFLRIIIVLGMIRSAIGTQQVPPGTLLLSTGLRTGPNAEFSFDEPMANSSQFCRPIMMASASIRRCTAVPVNDALKPFSMLLAACRGCPA